MPRPLVRLNGETPWLDIGSYGRLGATRRDRLSPEQLAVIARTVRRTPEVMIKMLNAGGADLPSVARHFEYLDRNGELEIETDEGEKLKGKGSAAALVEDWELALDAERPSTADHKPREAGKSPKLVHKMIFSMPTGTPPEKVLSAVKDFAREEFGAKHRYAMVMHTDEPHPHVHLVVRAVGSDGRRLRILKATLRDWRREFARYLREHGVAANATERAVRGVTKPQKRDGIYRAGKRRASTHWNERAASVSREMAAIGLNESIHYDNDYRLSYTDLGSTQNLSISYDPNGNITSRSDVAGGASWTYDPTRKHAVTRAGSSAYVYAYDANGNMTSRQGSTISWSSYNYPTSVGAGSGSTAESISLYYGPDRQRWEQSYSGNGSFEFTYYVGNLLDVVQTDVSSDYRHYVYAGTEPVAVYSRKSNGTNTVSYILSDHQGSVSALTNSSGGPVVNESFSPYGNRRNPSTWSGAASNTDLTTAAGITRQGYTFQTQLGLWMGMNHMNGRVQDSITGRFLSPDPNIPNQTNSQDYNRYSYAANNPVTLTDPTGMDECGDYCDGGGGDDSQTVTVTGHGCDAHLATNNTICAAPVPDYCLFDGPYCFAFAPLAGAPPQAAAPPPPAQTAQSDAATPAQQPQTVVVTAHPPLQPVHITAQYMGTPPRDGDVFPGILPIDQYVSALEKLLQNISASTLGQLAILLGQLENSTGEPQEGPKPPEALTPPSQTTELPYDPAPGVGRVMWSYNPVTGEMELKAELPWEFFFP